MSDYFDYVEQYRAALASLPETSDVFRPRLQTRGLLIELALKTYICATGMIVKGHNLEKLAHVAQDRGLELSSSDWDDRITKVNKIYNRHKDWNADYLSRYPTPDRGLAVWITPGHAALDVMIGQIVDQAHAKWDAM